MYFTPFYRLTPVLLLIYDHTSIGVSVHIFLQFVTALGQKLKNHVFVKRGVCKSAFGLVYTIFSMLDHLYL